MKEKFEIAHDFYKEIINYYSSSHPNRAGFESRISQAKSIVDNVSEKFNFDKIICIETGSSQDWEDGIFGVFLGRAAKESGGSFYSVDNNSDYNERCKEIFSSLVPDLDIEIFTDDSVNFLKNIDIIPNLVHLDSMDLNISDPFPSALHGWMEFLAIKDKMPSGSIIIVDDNYLKGTWIDWRIMDKNKEVIETKRYTIDYPIIGKGAHIYQWCLDPETEWDLIGNHYLVGPNIKLIIQKR
jgi:hypothetical protein